MFWVYATLGLALIYLPMTGAAPSWRRSLIKTAPLALLTLGAALWGPLWLALGLGLSALGDLALSRDGERAFLAGLISFALAHLAYVVLFLDLGGAVPLRALVLLALALSTEFWLTPYTGALRWPVRGYVAVIGAMGALALGLPEVSFGAILFILSDMVLALQLFRLQAGTVLHQQAGRLLWGLYIAAQLLIFTGILGVSLP